MSAISKRFHFDTSEDVFWVIGFFIGSIITTFALLLCALVMQYLYCIPENPIRRRQRPKYTKLHSTTSVVFATICIILIFSTYPICTQYYCGYNLLGNVYYNFILDSYILAKLFLYFLFIGRLFNTQYKKIYKYPNYIQYLLHMVMCVIIVTTIISNIASLYNFQRPDLNDLIVVWVCVYMLADFILSGFTLILFLRPLWNKDTLHASPEHATSVVMKYLIISSLQTIAAMMYGISLIVRVTLGWFDSASPLSNSYLDICNLIQMMDMLMTIVCIYLGFVRKHSYNLHCDLCESYVVSCFLSCCCGYHITHYHHQNWNKGLLQNEIKPKEEVTIGTITDMEPITSESSTTGAMETNGTHEGTV